MNRYLNEDVWTWLISFLEQDLRTHRYVSELLVTETSDLKKISLTILKSFNF